jgi:hypothetical protein
MKTIKRELSNVKIDIQNPEEAANQNVGRYLICRLQQIQVLPLDKEENRLATLSVKTGNKFQRHL